MQFSIINFFQYGPENYQKTPENCYLTVYPPNIDSFHPLDFWK